MIYFDNSATTKIYPEVAEFICKHSQQEFCNPSGLYFPSLQVKQEMQEAKQKLLKILHATNKDIIFTASATEANNYALRCFVNKNKKLLISEGEHASIYQTALYLQQNQVEVEFIKTLADGTLDIEDLKHKLTDNVGLVSFIHVNNETGAINDAKKIGEIIKEKCPTALIHCDGVQAFCKMDINLNDLGIDMYTLSSHKVHGPRGVGALIFNSKTPPKKPLIFGGGQENGWRSGTENASSILGFVMASEIMQKDMARNNMQVRNLKWTLLELIQELNFTINGSLDKTISNILSISFENIKGEVLVHMLEQDKIYVSTGSSCNSKHTGNRVLMSMGKNKQQEAGNIRISFSEQNTMEEVKEFANILIKDVNKIKGLEIWKK